MVATSRFLARLTDMGLLIAPGGSWRKSEVRRREVNIFRPDCNVLSTAIRSKNTSLYCPLELESVDEDP